jgi:PPIC-type PPIASE domain
MRSFWIASLLLAGLAFAQTSPAPTGKKSLSAAADDDDDAPLLPPSASTVALDAPVLTIKGFCPTQTAGSTPNTATKESPRSPRCETVVTRAEFEALANAISPTMGLQVRRQLAEAYPRILVMAHEADLLGLGATSRFSELQRFSTDQLLSQEMARHIQEESSKLPESAIEDYYRDNPAPFEQADLQRLLVPNRKHGQTPSQGQANSPAAKDQQKQAEDEMSKLAKSLRERAAAGEDFSKLQHEAFEAAGIGGAGTSTSLKKVRRESLPTSQASVFDLKPGEVSQVFIETSGDYIYKLVWKQEKPLAEVRDEIRSTLQTQRVQDGMRKIRASFTTDTNKDYFGAPVPAPAAETPPNADRHPDLNAAPKSN